MQETRIHAAALGIGLALSATGALAAPAETGKSFVGSPVAVGQGEAQVVVDTDGQGKPLSVSVLLSEGALSGLPGAEPGRHEWEYVLPMPEGGPRTGYDHAALNWNPAGHPPPGIYAVPHFDVHFYLIGQQDRERVTFQGAGAADAAKPPAAELLAEGYVAPPDTAVEKMGIHGLDPRGPEFHGQPFTHTFIYGYYQGKLVFVEPMVATAFLTSKPDVTAPVKRPQSYSYPAYYPSEYRVRYDPARKQYALSLGGLVPWQMEAVSALPQK
ncbi:MAG: DUF5602 domain-containing protein [Rhodospirillales bacterium]|nr:DUF5602 domain-containing protein [Rhodospirillales bacterium]